MSHRGRRWGRWMGVAAIGLAVAPLVAELRISASARRPSDAWRDRPIRPRGATKLGVSFRPLQAEALGMDPGVTLRELLDYPFELLRLAAHWRRIEVSPGAFDTAELDLQVELAEAAGKQIILSVGAIKNFGYPEFFVPDHFLARDLPEHSLVTALSHPGLAGAAGEFVTKIVDRYRTCPAIVGWQVEHEAADPLGLEHSWRLGAGLVASEVAAARAADPTRPIMMNGFLPTSTPVSWMQRWRTRDQGDSLLVAQQLTDVLGIDYYPRHAVLGAGGLALYLDGGRLPWRRGAWRRISRWAEGSGRRVMISEGQAEPWEVVTVPPSPRGLVPYSCPPERVIDNYNACLGQAEGMLALEAYLFWGAEYWLLRKASGDDSYLGAFGRLLEES
ncbi:MAG: hypothetical protein WA751_04155 [Candidatus Dormiibacterota bacterium]